MRRTVELGTNRTRLRVIFFPASVQSSMVPTPDAYTYDPPNPVMGCGVMGLNDLKSLRSGDMWQEAPESSTKGKSLGICPCSWEVEYVERKLSLQVVFTR